MHKVLGIVLFVLLVGFAGAAQANHTWGKYHWDLSTADTIADPIDLGDNVSAEWDASLALASSDWNTSVVRNELVAGMSNDACDPTLGQVEICNSAYGENGWLGIAQIWAYRGKAGHIAQAVVKLNDTYFSLPTYNTAPWRNLVMCQEVGHTFGLGHQDENFSNTNLGTCTDYTSDPDGSIFGQQNNEHPNQHDYDMLAEIYAHLNGTTDDGSSDGGGKGNGKGGGNGGGKPSTALNDPSEWGTAISEDAQGRNSLFVRNINGYQVITHVLWVPGHEGEHSH